MRTPNIEGAVGTWELEDVTFLGLLLAYLLDIKIVLSFDPAIAILFCRDLLIFAQKRVINQSSKVELAYVTTKLCAKFAIPEYCHIAAQRIEYRSLRNQASKVLDCYSLQHNDEFNLLSSKASKAIYASSFEVLLHEHTIPFL